MKNIKMFLLLNLFLLLGLTTGCVRSRNEIWEDSKSAQRHVNRGFRSLGGKHGESRQIANRNELDPSSAYGADFIPLTNDEFPDQLAMSEFQQPKESPGDLGSSIPGVEAFSDPSDVSGLALIFKNIQFPYDSNLIKGRENFMHIARIADFMKKNPNEYVFIEGHCDEKGSEAYNLALGSRRANAVRNLLISEGVESDRLFTISYGKERPLTMESSDEARELNRRAQFKVWERGA